MRNQLEEYIGLVESAFRAAVSKQFPSPKLTEAVSYSLTSGGKRVRGALLLAFCDACGGDVKKAVPFAAGLEMIHAYSLIHDDLPCMDNDDFRRGKPSAHKAFGEAFALLAGDSLLNLAAEVMLNADIPPDRLIRAAKLIFRRSGMLGMIGGQALELETAGEASHLQTVRKLKTGALFIAAAEAGCVLAGAVAPYREAARNFANNLGQAYQLQDDLLDCGNPDDPSALRVSSEEELRENIATLIAGARESLAIFEYEQDFLVWYLNELTDRKN